MYRVVIADDEVLIRMYIREILENNGYEVVGEAEDGLDAIAVCRQKKPDFVIMDINMPVMTGLEATKVINEDKLAGFVIILTAYRDKEIADQAVNTDVMGYIVKPVDEDTLIPAVKIAIHNYKQREAMAKEFHKTQEALDDRKYLDRASPILNSEKKVIGALTYEYPNAGADTESIRIINNQEGKQDPFNRQLGKASDYLQDAILLYDANGICTFVNPKAEVLYQDKGFELPLIGRRCSELHITDCNWSDLTEHRGVIRREVRTPNFIMDAVISGIWENGTCQGAAIIFRDKTVVHQMEDEIAYRVALIHEVHHRVKNNLQTIISLIGLEAVHTKDEKVKAFAKTITSHVRSMNITYDLLSHTGSENVGLKVLISRITDVLLENNCLKETCSISTRVDGDDVILTETTASTVALIVNELVQNSLKYAFKDRKQGQIRLKIEKGASYSWITVQDDGCGFDNKKISRANSGLGLRLISSLVQSSLKGELFIETGENGTSIRFSFSMPQAG